MAKRGETREKILGAAAQLAAEHGISATAVDDIAAEAGVAKGSVYYNFGSKERLYAELLGETLQRAGQRLRESLDGARPGDAVRAVAEAFLRGLQEHPSSSKVVAAELFRLDRPWRESLAEYRSLFFSIFAEALEADGRPASPANAAAVFGSTIMVGFERMLFADRLDLEEAIAAIEGAD
ncbi:MAG TPA: TetR/AcrR family transcriptional regulator [Candidatus Agrococcus pullicola]|uniref:TetR/AcrR family transcriptional regulator n=1 Tax=Candidatus Agrococcus pullicola TaxID=2838429 RepID=A0A9D2C8V9_9MICO|nr:TetR/AcrR family transcriptional regulator [Candidatus Agrococcus pullicola]